MPLNPTLYNMRKTIAILCYMSSLNPRYSVAGLVTDQINMLKKYHKGKIVFITSSDFHDQDLLPKEIEVRYFDRYPGTHDPKELDIIEFEKYVFETSSVLRNHLKDCQYCFTHDLMFLDNYLPLNWAVRTTGELLPKLKWFHWIHSAPSPRKNYDYPHNGRYMPMKNAKWVYLNRTNIPELAAMYNLPENDIVLVHNFIDFVQYLKLHPITEEMVNSLNLLEADTICVYPCRLVESKQPNKLIKTMNYLQRRGQKVKLIICNPWSNAEVYTNYIKELRKISELGDNLIFTSEFKSQWCKDHDENIELGVPRAVICDLMHLSDLFILPSKSESASLIMLEAALCKNLIVLNDDLWMAQEFGGQKINGNTSSRCLYSSYGSLSREIGNYLPTEEGWYENQALEIHNLQQANQAIQFFKFVRKRHNSKWIYFNELLPLIR